jgi:hypothetical protein
MELARMGRKPIGKPPMTPAERQRRSRARAKRHLVVKGGQAEKAERRTTRLAKVGKQLIAAPPGVTFWRTVSVTTPEGPTTVLAPITKPAASVTLPELTTGEIRGLIELLTHEQERRTGKRAMLGPEEHEAFDLMNAMRETFGSKGGWDTWGNELEARFADGWDYVRLGTM